MTGIKIKPLRSDPDAAARSTELSVLDKVKSMPSARPLTSQLKANEGVTEANPRAVAEAAARSKAPSSGGLPALKGQSAPVRKLMRRARHMYGRHR